MPATATASISVIPVTTWAGLRKRVSAPSEEKSPVIASPIHTKRFLFSPRAFTFLAKLFAAKNFDDEQNWTEKAFPCI